MQNSERNRKGLTVGYSAITVLRQLQSQEERGNAGFTDSVGR